MALSPHAKAATTDRLAPTCPTLGTQQQGRLRPRGLGQNQHQLWPGSGRGLRPCPMEEDTQQQAG